MKTFPFLTLCGVFFYASVAASNDQKIDFFTLSFENDVLFQEDGEYTNGLGVAWGY